jgi:hypothetical protein
LPSSVGRKASSEDVDNIASTSLQSVPCIPASWCAVATVGVRRGVWH